MILSTAHLFYIPVLILVGVFIGYYVGRYHVDVEAAQSKRKAARRKKAGLD